MKILQNQKFLLFFFFLYFSLAFNAQEYNLLNQFNRENSSISGNLVFDIVEDNKSFIWIATENGASRFDGKRFYNYTTKNGLPVNEVIQLIKDKNGTIWANCLRQPPSYFDEKKNQFITLKASGLEKICSSLLKPSFDYEGNLVFIPGNNVKFFKILNDKNVEFFDKDKIKTDVGFLDFSYISSVNNIEDSFLTKSNNIITLNSKINQTSFFNKSRIYTITENTKIDKFFDVKNSPFSYKKITLPFSKPVKWVRIGYENIRIITQDNHFLVYSLDSLNLQHDILVDEDANCGYLDSKNRLIVGSAGNGIKVYSTSMVKKIDVSSLNSKKNFISINSNSKGEVFAGNLDSEIIKYDGKKIEKIKLPDNCWIRKMIFFGDKPLIISDNGYSFDFKTWQRIINDESIVNIKNGVKINDTTVLLTSIQGIFELNIATNKYQKLNFPRERVASILPINHDEYYVISSEGLYLYNYKTNEYRKILEKYNLSKGIFDGRFLFLSTFRGEIYVLQNNKIVKTISNNDGLPEKTTAISLINRQIWIGSNSGIYIINYQENNGNFILKKISKSDALNSELIIDFTTSGNQIYAVTGKDIFSFPKNYETKINSIPTEIISLNINGKQTTISDSYSLQPNENDISITFSGVDLLGHLKNFQYRVNKNKWIDLDENVLNLRLKRGKSILEIRALDDNKNPGPIKEITFQIKEYFYESIYFGILLGGLLFGGLAFAYFQMKIQKQKRKFREKLALEAQRNKITEDLHDDIGATLSSLQINSTIANELLKKQKITEAQNVLSNIEIQSQKLSENMGDIVWSLRPTEDALMTLSMRIKNFANEILGNTNIDYSIEIDEKVDTEITDFTVRKNIVLIAKEALNNAAKYSKATEIKVIFTKIKDVFELQIYDNGIGFNPDEKRGNGLQNMKKRATEISGNFSIENKNGTSVKLSIPKFRD